MKNVVVTKLIIASLAVTAGLLLATPAHADWGHGHGGGWGHGHGGGVNLSFSYGYNPYYGGYYGYPYGYGRPVYYGYPAYYAPPPTVVYEAPPQVVYAPAAAPISVNQTSETYTDDAGRTCREYQSTGKVAGHVQPTYGTACLQPDGSWRIVQ